jgi:hypothetical protein
MNNREQTASRLNRRRLDRRLSQVADQVIAQEVRRKASRHAACLAERLGILARPARCEWCGCPWKRLERHHPDHDEPLAVLYLCRTCHQLADTTDL